ncbi:uncharacterized protein RCO7_09705 [Rhynchosporium graminicola]|uniref:MYND-type domain-containing protein n=1 Tax=Rhynchosporium graminicola TaxID=2792576 RepID=A0A1E1LBS2_9HELO|nr:uncharacterized protein RCO7_09705 [Rhynchosporium commune]
MSSGSKDGSRDRKGKGKMKATVEPENEVINAENNTPLQGNAAQSSSTDVKGSPPRRSPRLRSMRKKKAKSRTPTPELTQLPDVTEETERLINVMDNMAIPPPNPFQCHKCNKREPKTKAFSKCPQCKAVKYCGKDCRQKDHKAHKKECANLAKQHNVLEDAAVTIIEERDAQVATTEANNETALNIIFRNAIIKMNKDEEIGLVLDYWIDSFRLWVSDGYPGRRERCAVTDLMHQFVRFLKNLKKLDSFWAPWLLTRNGMKDCLARATDVEKPITIAELKQKCTMKNMGDLCISIHYRKAAQLVCGKLSFEMIE